MLKNLIEAVGREEVRSISRRYFISNGFDGTLTAIGISVGSFLSGIPDGFTVFKIGMGAMIGLVTSGVWSVWEIERAEKLAELHEIEDAMLEKLEDTELQDRKREARIVNALASGIGPAMAVFLTVSPFLLERVYVSMLAATLLSIGVGVSLLFGFGAYMGRISEQNWLKAGIRMGLAGLVVGALNIIIPG